MTATGILISRDLCALPSGALWIPSSRSLIVADLHLGYSWAQRRRGELGPLADEQTRAKLLAVTSEMRPAEIVFLGDIVHAPRPCEPEREWIEGTINMVANRARLISVRGNHDRAFSEEFGHLPVENVPLWQTERITAVHGDRLDFPVAEQHTLLVGHLHPSLCVRDSAGASRRLPLFLHSLHCVVLPAFSPFSKGFEVSRGLPAPLASLFGQETVEAIAITGTRAMQLGDLEQAITRLWSADVGSPAHFRNPHTRRPATGGEN